jgi:catechol 2,3-dioxygenase-like lactoylglutathione lyase family enzyme
MSANLRFVMLMTKDVPKAVRFYNEGLGLPLLRMSDRWAELDTGSGPPLALKAVDG